MSTRACVVFLFLVTLNLWAAASVRAAETNDELLQDAAERIEKHRKADAMITVVNETGEPVPGVQVVVEQASHAFLFGCNFFAFGKQPNESDEQAYRTQFAELFNYATLGFYWPSYERRQGSPNHAYAETVARWCRAHGITPKGHPLAWNFMDPPWLPQNPEEVRRLQLERIDDCVTHMRGLIDVWDVVNEATHFERAEFKRRAPKMTRMWEETGRIEFVDQCFQIARKAGPSATLVINDYRTDPAYAKLIDAMAQPAGKKAYDVIGIQSHMHGGVWDNRKIWEVCQRFARFDVPLHFTELTVVSGDTGWERPRPWDSTPAGEQQQAKDVKRIYTMLFSHPSVAAITWWDFADRNAWQGAPAGLIGKDLQPKPAYLILKDLVRNRWWTKVKQAANKDGQVAFRGFLGDYKFKVLLDNGKVIEGSLTLVANDKNDLRVVVK